MQKPDSHVNAILAAAQMQQGAMISVELRDAINGLGKGDEFLERRLQVAARLGEVDSPIGAGFLAVWFGGGVESGLDPVPTTKPILDAMLRFAKRIPTPAADDDDTGRLHPDPETCTGLEFLGQGLVAHLSRSPDQLADIAAHEGIVAELERVEYASAGPTWVLELTRKCSGELLVLHVQGRRAYRMTYRNISNCFHLFTLLQAALAGKCPDARRVSKHTLAVAQGEVHGQASDSAWWHFGRGDVAKADFAGSVWGEARPDSIPQIDGQQVMLLWPKILADRSWDAGFFGPFLSAAPPGVTITEELSVETFEEWRLKLGLPDIPQKTWWQFWKK